MKTNTSIVLAAVAAGLGLFIYFFERHQPSTGELEDRNDRVVPTFDRDHVDRLVLGAGEDRVELERVGGEDESPDGAVGEWEVRHPLNTGADGEAVDNLLSAVDWLEQRRLVEEPDAVAQARFGLLEPRRQLAIRLRGQEFTLKVGADAPGDAVYVARSGEANRVYVVDRDFLDDLSKDANALRDQRIVALDGAAVTALRAEGRFHVEREGDLAWVLRTPLAMRADRQAVQDLVRSVESLRAARFIADGVEADETGQYGLDSPAGQFVLQVEDRDEPVVLRLGQSCEGHSDERYVTVLGTGTVACVTNESVQTLSSPIENLQDLRLTSRTIGEITRLEWGEPSVALWRHDGNWHIGGDGDEPGPVADGEAVAELVRLLSETDAVEVVGDLSQVGLAGEAPQGSIPLHLSVEGDDAPENIILRRTPRGMVARRGQEDVALVLPEPLTDEFGADPVRFRSRRVLDREPDDVEGLEVQAGSLTQKVVRRDGAWHLIEPVAVPADEVSLRGLVRQVARLDAERFVASRPAVEHRLARPRLRVRLQWRSAGENEREQQGQVQQEAGAELLIGAPDGDGYFAQLAGDDQAVFVIPGELVATMEKPLADKNLFAVQESDVVRVVLDRGRRSVTVDKEDGQWRSTDPAVLSTGAVERLLSRLAVARAVDAVAFGPPGGETGLRQPTARLTLQMAGDDEGGERVLLVGGQYGDGEQRRVYIRRADVDVTFGLPLDTVEPILRNIPPPAKSPRQGGTAGADA